MCVFSTFECRCLSHLARARRRACTHTPLLPEGQKSIDVTPDVESPPSRRETRISACYALTNEDIQSVFFFFFLNNKKYFKIIKQNSMNSLGYNDIVMTWTGRCVPK